MIKVSCICVTQPGREGFLRSAVACFDSQRFTIKERELIIVEDKKNGTTLGDLRNAGISMARGKYVMTWDDDDFYDDRRIAAQYDEIERERADLCMLRSVVMRCTCGAEFDSHDRKGGWECTMMALREKVQEYPPMESFEDKVMIDAMLSKGATRVTIRNASHLYVKRYHGNNTIDLDGHRMIFRKAGHSCKDMERVATA